MIRLQKFRGENHLKDLYAEGCLQDLPLITINLYFQGETHDIEAKLNFATNSDL